MAASLATCNYNCGGSQGRVIDASRADRERARCDGGISSQCRSLGIGAVTS